MREPAEYIEYIESLVATHPDLASCFIMDLNEVANAKKGDIEYPALILTNYDGILVDNNRDAKLNQVTCGFLIIDDVPNINDFDREREVLNSTYLNGCQVIEKMKYDADHCVEAIKGFQKNSVRYEMVGQVITTEFGFMFTFTIYADPVEYDPLVWK